MYAIYHQKPPSLSLMETCKVAADSTNLRTLLSEIGEKED
jgi:hypothetical protein